MKALFGGLFAVWFFGLATLEGASPLQRQPNVSLRLPASPPTLGFTSERWMTGQGLVDPIAITTPPGETNRLFILEQPGRVLVVTNLDVPTRTVFMDITNRVLFGGEQGLLGIAFHPGYATNRFFFLFYTTRVGGVRFDRLSRFETSPTDPNVGLSESELVLIHQRDDAENHNGGDLHFGPDGYLYVSLGDEGAGDDSLMNSQRIDKDFFAGILRIDIDKRPGSLPANVHAASSTNYAIPADNPFVGVTNFNGRAVNPSQVRTEFWAVGLRNPWRMSFDRPTGRLYVGDVGQGAREEIDIVTRGGNYGWNYREGKIARPGSPAPPAAFTAIDPIHDYPRSQGLSVTGGLVYRGQRLSQLFGAYLFADYGSGNIWALRYTEGKPVSVQLLTNDRDLVAFGVDPRNGDILMADLGEDRIKRLVYNDQPMGDPFPLLLSETGAFADLLTLQPNPGIVPYDLNVPFWSDHAQKQRWFTVPDMNQFISFSRTGNWAFPTGTVWVKHFELQLTNGVPQSTRRLETRFIVRDTNGVYGITYRWDETQTNAVLVAEQGMDESFLISDGGITRTQIWHYPSRSECLACHTDAGGLAVGFNTAQLNRDVNYGEAVANQIEALNAAGYFSTNITGIHTLPALAPTADNSHSLEYRVRSYLAANCAQCHQPSGPGLAFFDARISTPTLAAGLINGPLNNFGSDPANRVIKSGSPEQSMLLKRISTRGPGQMPPIDSTVVDTNAIQLVNAWIQYASTNYTTFVEWQLGHFGSTNSPLADWAADPDGDGVSNYEEYLTGHDPMVAASAWRVSVQRTGPDLQVVFPRLANRAFEVQATTNLFDPSSWTPLDVPGNRPKFPAITSEGIVPDAINNAPERYYRVRVFEP
jgi:uncharacterized repeat protein (TIGR03806 family)